MIDPKDRKRGLRVRGAILSSGLKQNEIARRAGVTPQAVARWIKTGEISRTHLAVLARETGHSYEWIDRGAKACQPARSAL